MKLGDRIRAAEPPIPANMYLAHIIGVCDLGEQYSDIFKNYSNKLSFTFEIHGQTHEVGGKIVARDLTKTMSIAGKAGSKCRSFFDGLMNKTLSDEEYKNLDPFAFIGVPVQVQVVLTEDGQHNNIAAVTPLPPYITNVPAATLPTFRWDCDAWDDNAFKDLPAWVQERLAKSTQFQSIHPSTDTIAVQPVQPMAQVAHQIGYQQPVQPVQPVAQGFSPVEMGGAVIPF